MDMADRTRAPVGSLPPLSEDSSSATSSLARGRETRTALLQKLRPPPLVHAWDFWHEKATAAPTTSPGPTDSPAHKPQLSHLHSVADVGSFWSVFNNIELDVLPARSAVHLFHKSITPVWEDPRNARGGSWTFRVPKASAAAFWKSTCLLAVGEQLQEAVKDSARKTFHDDICGVSYCARFGATVLICVWNRDANNAKGIEKIKQTVFESLPSDLALGEGSYYYKKHSEHASFDASCLAGLSGAESERPAVVAPGAARAARAPAPELEEAQYKSAVARASVEAMEREVDKVKNILQEVKVNDETVDQKVADEIKRAEAQKVAEDIKRGETLA